MQCGVLAGGDQAETSGHHAGCGPRLNEEADTISRSDALKLPALRCFGILGVLGPHERGATGKHPSGKPGSSQDTNLTSSGSGLGSSRGALYRVAKFVVVF